MYYQKLESLKNEENMKEVGRIIDSLDIWLALTPKRFRDKLLPEVFSKDEDISVEIGILLFERLTNLKILKENYYLQCECGSTVYITDNVNNVLSEIKRYNIEKTVCDLCEEHEKLTTDNVVIVYELLEEPNEKFLLKKKGTTGFKLNQSSNTLSDAIQRNPEPYRKSIDRKSLSETLPDGKREAILFLLSDD